MFPLLITHKFCIDLSRTWLFLCCEWGYKEKQQSKQQLIHWVLGNTNPVKDTASTAKFYLCYQQMFLTSNNNKGFFLEVSYSWYFSRYVIKFQELVFNVIGICFQLSDWYNENSCPYLESVFFSRVSFPLFFFFHFSPKVSFFGSSKKHIFFLKWKKQDRTQ